MYLHIGNKKSVKKEKIIGIFDLDTATVSGISKDFINRKQREGLLEYDDDDLPRSFVLYEENKKSFVKLSRISSVGLKIRADGNTDNYSE
ncbi:MAG: DUF370 domain-containing protein [Clostridia bacterium]|nr:DUF370 domain-containing protein [Clostridia bacterium]